MTIFSIIIPVYNAADYLGSCIQSIVNQDFSDFELILIDDGSVDGSLKVCQSWQAKDERIRVHHQKKNKGQGAARNVGLRDAKGQYVLFIDADDAIAEDTLAQNFQILNNNPDIECLQFPIYMKYGTPDAYLKKGKEQFYKASINNFKNLILVDGVISWIVCDKIFKRNSIQDMYFREDIKYEDNYFMMEYIQKLNNFYLSEKGVYYYYHRTDSTTTSAITELKERSTTEVLYLILSLLDSIIEADVFYKYLIRLINVEKSLKINFKTSTKGFEKFKKDVRFVAVLKSQRSIKEKIKILLYKYA